MNKNLKPQLASNTDEWTTPRYLYNQLEEEFGKFDFDPCPIKGKENALIDMEWKGNVFINPPYSNVKEFLNKGLIEMKKKNAKRLVYLIIPRTSTKYWNNLVMRYADLIYWIPYRLKFGESKSPAPFPSCIIVFNDLVKKKQVMSVVWKYKRKVCVRNNNGK